VDRRASARVTTVLPVRLWGLDAYSLPFIQLAIVTSISAGGATIQGVNRRIRPGEVLQLQYGTEVVPFRVVWIRPSLGCSTAEIGVESLTAETTLWGVDLQRCSQITGMG
jgi:hypothetical protein